MDTTERTLLVILAAALAFFLILATVSVILVIRVLRSVNRVTAKAEQLVDSAETVGQVFRQTAEQMSFVRIIHNVANLVSKHHSDSKKGE